MYVREYGQQSAPAAVLLHGQMLDGSIFGALAARLAARFRVLVPDLPGYGRTPLLSPYSVAGVREAIEAELAARGVRRAFLVGYSYGGYHALALALGGRVQIDRLVLLASLGWADPPVRGAFRSYAQAVRDGLQLGPAFAQLALPPGWAARHPDVAPRIAAAADRVARETYLAEFEAIAELQDLRPRLGGLRVPTLVRAGDLDRNIPIELGEALAAAIPGACLEVVPGCAHLLLEQDAERTEASIEAFLSDAGD